MTQPDKLKDMSKIARAQQDTEDLRRSLRQGGEPAAFPKGLDNGKPSEEQRMAFGPQPIQQEKDPVSPDRASSSIAQEEEGTTPKEGTP